ncbi:MAG: DNRLRE domain-containing protein, partial [Ruminococcus sp.]|nr:DNRLRE domain-containing protein [Ruminococcus sp.]
MKQIKKRILSGIIALSLVITDSSIAVFANENNSNLTAKTTKTTEIEKSYITNELTDLRSEYSKTYEKSDGSRISIITASPLHYYNNVEKTWEEYDNTLLETKNKDGEFQLTNNNPTFQVEIPEKLSENNSINAKTKDYEISIVPLNVSKSNVISDNSKNKLKKQKKLKDKTIDDYVQESIKSSTVEFEDVYSGTETNLEYEVVSNSLKETISLTKAPEKETSYKFELTAKGLTAELKEDGAVIFKNNNESVFVIPAPFMTDSQNNYSNDIKTELTKNKDNYILSYTPSIEWLSDEERVYPVSIDPTITLNDSKNIDDAYVTSIRPDNNYGKSAHLIVGKIRGELSPVDEYTDEYLSYIKFQELPKNIWNNSYITNAVLNLNVFSAVTSQINAYEVTSDWSESSVTYKNRPTFKNEIIDYQNVLNDDIGYLGWDITNIVENWYSNPDKNFGIMLDSSSIYMYGSRIYASEYTGQNPIGNPYITIEYSPMTNSSYENSRDIDIGRAGKVNINDFSGTLRLTRSDLNVDGNIMPVNISMIYDENNLSLPENLYTNVYGNGFRTNYSQMILYNSEKEFYTYIGEDARPIYFEKHTDDEGNITFTDYSERGYELSIDGTSYENYSTITITDSSDHRYFFDNGGRLVKIADMNLSCVKEANVTAFSSEEINGIININYAANNSLSISSITDGVGRVYEFVYNDKLKDINYKGNNDKTLKTVSYKYNADGTLSSITYPNNRIVRYNWSDNYIIKAINSDGYSFAFTYTDESLPRVQTIKEYDCDGTLGENISVSYSVDKTTFTDNKTDEKEILQFDKHGNLLTSQNAYGYTLVNQYGTSEGNTPSKAHNELINSFGYQKNEVNLLSNSRAQNGVLNWSGITVSTDEKMFGTHSFKLSGKSGTASQTVNLTGGQTYVLSAYVKTKNTNGSLGASIKVNNGDITCNSDAQYITGTSKWTRIATTFKANSNCAAQVALVLNSTNSLAEAYFDGIQLEKGTTISDYSYIINADFNDTSNWNSNSTQSQNAPSINSQKGIYCFANDETPFDSKCIKIFGDARYENSVYQEVTNLNGQKGDTYNFGGWTKANAASLRDNRTFGIKVEFFNDENLVGEAQSLSFNSYINDWQFNMSSATASDVYNKIKISAIYDYQVNYALFDRLLLQYDGISEIDDESSDETDEESSEDESSENQPITDAHGREIEYTDEDGVKTVTAYDDYDNITKSATQINGKNMESINGYSADGNYQISETNTLGKTTVFDYDNQLGLLKKITDPKGNSVSYSYDSADNIATVSQGKFFSTYSYDNGDRLTGINSCDKNSYSFGYDKFGALNSIKLGSQSLVQYLYDDNYILSGINYGNGQSINYSYDKSGNKLGISSNGTEKYNYYYDDFGTLLSVKDNVNNTVTSYSTDEDGIEYTQERKNNSLIHSYYNNGSSFVEYLNGSEKETEYASKEVSSSDTQPLIDWNRTSWKKNGYNTFYNVKNTTDEFGRLSNQEIFEANLSDNKQTESGKNTLIRKSYEYTSTNNGVNQSEQVSKIKYEGTYNNEIEYTYDANGNILSDGKYEYIYDSLNRLQQTHEISTNIHKHYTYNNEGNLVNVVTTKGPSTLNQTARSYDGIKMVSYDDKAITYDDLGNPLTYYNGTQFTWEMGRQLASAKRSDGTQITYKYNAEGLRTEKRIGENSVSYTLVESKITGQTDGTNTFYFRYDESDNLVGFELGSNQYFYITNLVGDIIAIVDNDGNCVVEYEYDPWGVCTIVSDTSNCNLGELNPFRYRGYYYDEETSLYYLQSRYYDP